MEIIEKLIPSVGFGIFVGLAFWFSGVALMLTLNFMGINETDRSFEKNLPTLKIISNYSVILGVVAASLVFIRMLFASTP